MAHDYQVRRVGESRSVTHYRVSAGPKGGSEVTVRVGMHGVFACLTCNLTSCAHAAAARDFAEMEQHRSTRSTPTTPTEDAA